MNKWGIKLGIGLALATIGIAVGLSVTPRLSGGPPAIVEKGQSNTVGFDSAANLSAGNTSFATPYPNIPIIQQLGNAVASGNTFQPLYYDGNTIHGGAGTLNPPSTYGSVGPTFYPSQCNDCMGPEPSLARALVTRSSTIQKIVKFANPGGGLAAWWRANLPDTPGGTPFIRAQFATFVANANVSPAAFYESDGENDAKNSTDAGNFFSNVQAEIADMRAAYGTVPYLWLRLHPALTLATYPQRDTVRQALVDAIEQTAYADWIDADALTQIADNTHLNADSQVTIGQSIDTQLAAMLVNSTITSTTLSQPTNPLVADGRAFSYTIDITVGSANAATKLSASLDLPSGVGFTSASGTGWTTRTSTEGSVTTVYAKRTTGSVGAQPTITINCTAPVALGSGSITANGRVVAANVQTKTTITNTTTLTAPAITADGTSGIKIPQNSTEWANLISQASLTGTVQAPDALWLMQEASGNLADSIGAFTLTVSGSNETYANSVSGWSTKSIRWINAATGSFQSTDVNLPDISATSLTMLCYVKVISAPSATRGIVGAGTSNFLQVQLNTTPRIIAADGANTATETNNPTSEGVSGVFPLVVTHNKTGTSSRFTTATEKLVPTFSASATGKKVIIGGSGGVGSAPAMDVLYCAMWKGTNAEITDANLKTILQTLGWTIGWTQLEQKFLRKRQPNKAPLYTPANDNEERLAKAA